MFPDHNSAGALLFAGIVVATFVSEDGATALAAALAKQNPALLPLTLAAAFSGIWIGDIGLYGLARLGGRAALANHWVKRFTSSPALDRAEDWFARHGSATVVASRFIPGTRLPTYLAAGLLRMPLRRFVSITGLGAAVWVALVFSAAQRLRLWLPQGTSPYVQSVLSVVVFAAVALLLQRLIPRTIQLLIAQYKKFSAWEFWPAWVFYPPVVAMCFWLGLKYRGFSLPASANPGQQNGGIVGESKAEILGALVRSAPDYTAETFLIEPGNLVNRMRHFDAMLHQHKMAYPCVLKPNVAQRGAGFRVIARRADAAHYLATVKAPAVLQRFVAAEKEAGIFYYRFPGQSRGEIFSITEKAFPSVTGTGTHTFEELIQADARASRIARTYLKRFPELADKVIPAGHFIRLVEAGNHCQGAIFRDGHHLYSESLRARIDEISQALPGFFIGRYDVRYSSDDDLRAGNGFTILELNGAASEATSIYDGRNSLLNAYKTLYRQWGLVFAIGAVNRARGSAPPSPVAIWKDWLHYRRVAASYPAAD
jgi:membrane protein DedA with SNARE-associated domain